MNSVRMVVGRHVFPLQSSVKCTVFVFSKGGNTSLSYTNTKDTTKKETIHCELRIPASLETQFVFTLVARAIRNAIRANRFARIIRN